MCIAISAFLFIAVVLVVSYAFLGNHVSKEAKETFQMLKKCLNDTNLSTNVVELVIPDGTCNDVDKTVFDLGAFNRLRRFYVGSVLSRLHPHCEDSQSEWHPEDRV